jgi:hypothetical protein
MVSRVTNGRWSTVVIFAVGAGLAGVLVSLSFVGGEPATVLPSGRDRLATYKVRGLADVGCEATAIELPRVNEWGEFETVAIDPIRGITARVRVEDANRTPDEADRPGDVVSFKALPGGLRLRSDVRGGDNSTRLRISNQLFHHVSIRQPHSPEPLSVDWPRGLRQIAASSPYARITVRYFSDRSVSLMAVSEIVPLTTKFWRPPWYADREAERKLSIGSGQNMALGMKDGDFISVSTSDPDRIGQTAAQYLEQVELDRDCTTDPTPPIQTIMTFPETKEAPDKSGSSSSTRIVHWQNGIFFEL